MFTLSSPALSHCIFNPFVTDYFNPLPFPYCIFNPLPTRSTLVASGKEVYKLEPRPYDQQETMFVNGRQFELALQISVRHV